MSYKYYIDDTEAIVTNGHFSEETKAEIESNGIFSFETEEEMDFSQSLYFIDMNQTNAIGVNVDLIKYRKKKPVERFKYKITDKSVTDDVEVQYLAQELLDHNESTYTYISVDNLSDIDTIDGIIEGMESYGSIPLNTNYLERIYEYCIDSIDGLTLKSRNTDAGNRLRSDGSYKMKFDRMIKIESNDESLTGKIIAQEKEYRSYVQVIPSEVKYFNGITYEYVFKKDRRETMSDKQEEEVKYTWSSERTKTVQFGPEYLSDQIRTRYAMFDRPLNGTLNGVIDSFVPRLLVASRMNTSVMLRNAKLPKTSVAISPWFAQMLQVKQMPFEQMCLFLGYTKQNIKDLLKKAKQQDYSITFIGYGGTNVNTLYWLTQMCELTGVVTPFKYVEIFENDDAEISNLLRFPKNPSGYLSGFNGSSKLALLGSELTILSRTKPETFPQYYQFSNYNSRKFVRQSYRMEPLTDEEQARVDKGEYIRRKHQYNENGNYIIDYEHANSKHIFYGAPNIETRERLSDIGNFISATHGSNNCSLHLNPLQDADIQVESYGMIQLGQFFMNQLKMAIGLIELLGQENIDLTEKDKIMMSYEFDGIAKKRCDRGYRFDMSFNGNMLDQDQAQDI